jgi:hypothetical protein
VRTFCTYVRLGIEGACVQANRLNLLYEGRGGAPFVFLPARVFGFEPRSMIRFV